MSYIELESCQYKRVDTQEICRQAGARDKHQMQGTQLTLLFMNSVSRRQSAHFGCVLLPQVISPLEEFMLLLWHLKMSFMGRGQHVEQYE